MHMRYERILLMLCIVLFGMPFFTLNAQTPLPEENWIRAVVWTMDGTKIVIATEQGSIRILSTTGKIVRTLQNGPANSVVALAWNPDGTKLASGGSDPSIKIWDIASGNILRTLKGHTFYVNSISWSPDGTKLVTTDRNDSPTSVRVWNPDTGQLLYAFTAGEAPIAAWNPNSKQFAIGQLQRIEIWDAASGQSVKKIATPEYSFSIAWSPDGTKIASGDSYANTDSVIRIWDVNTGQLLQTLTGHTNVILSVAWSPNGTKIASSSHDHTVRIWDAVIGKSLSTIQTTDSVFQVAWSPYGGRLAYGEVATPNTATAAGLKLVVPPSTFQDLQVIEHRCVTGSEAQQALSPLLDSKRLSTFSAKVKSLSDKQINPGCAADLAAVADSLQGK